MFVNEWDLGWGVILGLGNSPLLYRCYSVFALSPISIGRVSQQAVRTHGRMCGQELRRSKLLCFRHSLPSMVISRLSDDLGED